jgi:GNAT superfamily N-acetyltransferase
MELRMGVPPDWPTSVVPWLREALPREGIDAGRFARQVLCDPNFDPRGLILAYEGTRPVGLTWVVHRQVPLENAPSDSERGYVALLAVHPKHRRKGVGTALLNAGEAFLKERGAQSVWVSGYAPGYFLPGVDLAYPGALEFFVRAGYTEV